MVNGLKRFSAWCYRVVSTPVIAGSLALFILFMLFVLPKMAGRLSEMTGFDRSPDTSFIYSAADLYAMAEAYGAEGRAYYIYQRFTFDLIWPLVYLLFFLALITLLYRRLPPTSNLRLVNLLPFAGVLFDLLENSGAAYLMYRYPEPVPFLAPLVPVFTFLKWLMIGLSSLAIVVGLIILLFKQLKILK
jgi:hypothetical protein